MLLFLVVLGVLYWASLSIYAYTTLKKIFKRYKNFPKLDLPETYKAFTRKDFGQWDEATILRRSYTQFPARFFAMASFLLIYAFLATMHKYLRFPTSSMINFYRRWYGGTGFKFCFKVVEEFDSTKDIDTPIIVANHSTWMDIFYFGCTKKSLISFVAKKEVNQIPFVINCAYFLQCILVDRSSAEARNQVKKDIETRVKKYQQDKINNYPIIIFPEGTVSDGRSLMEFKNGAFQSLAPITLYCLKYQCKQYHVADNDMTALDNMLMTLCVNSTLRVFREKLIPKENETVQEYRQRSRKRISQMGGFKIYDCSYKEYFEYRKILNDKLKEQGRHFRV